jgi:ammonium transporter, Amt family
LITLYD